MVNKQHINVWPFPSHPPVPWTPEQVREYERQQRQQVPDAPL